MVTVVASTVVDVLGATIEVLNKAKEVDVIVLVLSVIDVNVELPSLIVTTSVVTDRNVEIFCSGKVATVDLVTTLSIVVVGTEMICVVVDPVASVVFVNGANVVSGSRVDTVTEGRLVGNGWIVGLPPVSRVVCMLPLISGQLCDAEVEEGTCIGGRSVDVTTCNCKLASTRVTSP